MPLSGKVALLNDAGTQVEEIRDLGSVPVRVKGNVRQFYEVFPPLDVDEQYDTYSDDIGQTVTRTWTVGPTPIPDRVTARQFKLALDAMGLYDGVTAWIAAQSRPVQIAFADSGTFVRDEPMMQAGFAALGFTEEQIDEFFRFAARI